MKHIIQTVLAVALVLSQRISAFSLTVEREGTYTCGRQPKQVLFSPDSSLVVLPLLDDKGFQIIRLDDRERVRLIAPPRSEKLGFAEGLFIPEKNAFFVSQMSTGYIYEYEYPSFSFRREISTGGVWPKFIAWSEDRQLLAVSNWVSNDVSLIDYESGTVLRTLKTKAAPRGLAFVRGGSELIVLCFDGGVIQKFSTEDGRLLASRAVQNSAMRHIAVNAAESKAFVSDMYHASLYELDLRTFAITRTWKVFNNPNTLALYKDRYLFASSRGPNNKKDYTLRSPANGKIAIIDTATGELIQTIQGGNQPTGLDISPDGTWLCFSNFQDANIELYRIED